MQPTVSLAARAVSSNRRETRHSPLTTAMFGKPPGIRSRRTRDAHRNGVAQGFAVTLRADQLLAVECPTGCNLHVIDGRAWITAEGAPRDVFASASANVPLACGARFVVSALHDAVAIVVTLPNDIRDARFALHVEDGLRVLRVTAGRSALLSLVSRFGRWIDAVERPLFAPLPRFPARMMR